MMNQLRKKRIARLEITALSLLIVLLVGVAYLRHYGDIGSSEVPTEEVLSIDDSSTEQLLFIDLAFTAFSSWDSNQLKQYMAQETRAQFTDVELQQVVQTLEASLGDLVHYSPPERLVRPLSPTGRSGEQPVSYQFVAQYERGTADVLLELVREHSDWELFAINVYVRDTNSLSV